jgi:hypothetical protein
VTAPLRTRVPIEQSRARKTAEYEWRVAKLTSIRQPQRESMTTSGERKPSLTERKGPMEVEALFAESSEAPPDGGGGGDGGGDSGDRCGKEAGDNDMKVYNPLILPLAWDG